MFVCEECGHNEGTVYTHKETYPCGDGFAVDKYTTFECDKCGGNMVEGRPCPICGETYIAKNSDLCEDCFEDSCTLENCLEMGLDATEEYELNGFLASIFSKNKIEEILLEYFKQMPLEEQEHHIEEYCAEDKYYLTSFLEEKLKNENLY